MKGVKLPIDEQASKLRSTFNGEPSPEINDCNFFTGDYEGMKGLIGINSHDPDDWNMFWRQVVKQEPPGELPPGAMAIMIAHDSTDAPVEYLPEHILHENHGTTVRWQRRHLNDPDVQGRKSQFAVLLIYPGDDMQIYRDVYEVEERQRQKDMKGYTDGADAPVTVGPSIKLKGKQL